MELSGGLYAYTTIASCVKAFVGLSLHITVPPTHCGPLCTVLCVYRDEPWNSPSASGVSVC